MKLAASLDQNEIKKAIVEYIARSNSIRIAESQVVFSATLNGNEMVGLNAQVSVVQAPAAEPADGTTLSISVE